MFAQGFQSAEHFSAHFSFAPSKGRWEDSTLPVRKNGGSEGVDWAAWVTRRGWDGTAFWLLIRGSGISSFFYKAHPGQQWRPSSAASRLKRPTAQESWYIWSTQNSPKKREWEGLIAPSGSSENGPAFLVQIPKCAAGANSYHHLLKGISSQTTWEGRVRKTEILKYTFHPV